jgi:hypothetical protein
LTARITKLIREGTVRKEIDAVIAALKIELGEAERGGGLFWKTIRCNRWIKQLPGAWTRRWKNLKIRGDIDGEIPRAEFVTHVRATLAYLEAHRDQIEAMPAWTWPFTALRKKNEITTDSNDEPIDAEFTDVPTPSTQRKLPKPKIVK